MRSSWAGPRPFALLRAGVRLSRGPLRCRAAHHSLRSCPSHPSRIPPILQLLSATTTLRSGPPHFAPYANAALLSSLLASLFTQLAMAPVAAFGQPTLPQTTRTRPAQFRCVGCALLRRLRSIRPAYPPHRYFSYRALPPAAQPTTYPARQATVPPIPPQQALTPAHPAARFPLVSQPPHR